MDRGADCYRRFLDGDESALADLIAEYNDGLVLYINSIVGSIAQADELAEDTFVKIVTKKPFFRGRSSFRTWLYAVGRNLALDHLRRQARSRTLPLDEAADLTDRQILENRFIVKERDIILHKAMDKLRPEYRQILWLTYFEGLGCKETAKIMGRSTHSIETAVYRARLALKQQLQKEGISDEDI